MKNTNGCLNSTLGIANGDVVMFEITCMPADHVQYARDILNISINDYLNLIANGTSVTFIGNDRGALLPNCDIGGFV